MKKGRTLIAALLGTAMIAALTLGGCGTDGYDDPSATTIKSATIIDTATLKGWIDEGKLNAPFGSRDRVVVVSASTFANWTTTTKGHIPGAVRLGTDELAKSRIEGLALATNMMPDGPMMDTVVKRMGIDSNTTIVFSLPKNSSIYDQSLPFWNFRYWGFARERLKILNGGDDSWEIAGLALSKDVTDKYTGSTYSVSQNAALKDMLRYSIGEVMSTVDALIATPALKDTMQLIEVRGPTTTPYITNAIRLQNPTMYMERLLSDTSTTPATLRNFVYPDSATLVTRMGELDVVDGANTTARVSATKKTISMCGASTSASPTFVLYDAVLSVPEGDIMMYDGSASQWNNYSSERLIAAYPAAAAVQRDAWSFNALGRTQGAMATSILTVWSAFSPVLGPSHTDMNQIEKEDKAYIAPITTTTTNAASGGGDISGC
jgi:3-mercaptopyruvate sulfurtransferase SseA